MDTEKKIIETVFALKKRFTAVAAARFALDSFAAALMIFLLSVAAAAYFPQIVLKYTTALIVWLALEIIIFYRAALDFLPLASASSLIKKYESSRPALSDDLSVSHSFALDATGAFRAGVSGLFRAEHIRITAEKLSTADIAAVFPFALSSRILRAAVFIAALAMFYVAAPIRFRSGLSSLSLRPFDFSTVKVLPGDTEIIAGEGLDIEISIPRRSMIRPIMSVFRGKNKETIPMSSAVAAQNRAAWTTRLENIYADTGYYFIFPGARTKTYTIKIVRPAMFISTSLEYEYPKYTGVPDRIVDNNPNLECYPGTRVKVTAAANQPIDSAALVVGTTSLKMSVSRGGFGASASFVVSKKGAYKFATSKNGREWLSPEYDIEIISDEPPRVRILSPAHDMLAAGDEKFPVVYSYDDDFGIVKISFATRLGEKISETRLNAPAGRSGIADTPLDIARLKIPPGSSVEYYIEAVDAAGLTGRSKTYYVEIASYEKSHAEILKKLGDFADGAMNLLSAQASAVELAKSAKQEKWGQLSAAQRAVLASSEKLSSSLKETLKQMLGDPYFDGYLMEEYKGMSDSLEYLNRRTLPAAVRASDENDAAGLSAAQSEAMSALESMAILASDVMKYQRLADVENNFSKMEKRFASALDSLSAGKMSDISSDIEEISRLMSEIEQLIREMPQMLPEEFVNSQAAREMDFSSARGALAGIKDALARSDTAAARTLLDNFKKELAKMRDSLKKAAANLAVKSAPSENARSMAQASSALESIVKKQRLILADTEHLENIRRSKVLAEQGNTLKSLARRQKDIIDKAAKSPAAPYISDAVSLMKKVLAEFESGKVYHSQKFLEDIVARVKSAASRMPPEKKDAHSAPSALSPAADAADIANAEQEILSLLRSEPRVEFTSAEKRSAFDSSKKQVALRQGLAAVRKDLERLASRTAVIPRRIFGDISAASKEMLASSENLAGMKTAAAGQNQRNVIELLSSSSEELSSSGAAAAAASFGSPAASGLRPASGKTAGGFSGGLVEKVRLPSAGDYKVPQEFREEILKYMRERYPGEYEELIKKYYRRLVE